MGSDDDRASEKQENLKENSVIKFSFKKKSNQEQSCFEIFIATSPFQAQRFLCCPHRDVVFQLFTRAELFTIFPSYYSAIDGRVSARY